MFLSAANIFPTGGASSVEQGGELGGRPRGVEGEVRQNSPGE